MRSLWGHWIEGPRRITLASTRHVPGMDACLVTRAGECGLRFIVILLGALEGLQVAPKVLSYEGPFGVRYVVASFRVGDTGNGRAGGFESRHTLDGGRTA